MSVAGIIVCLLLGGGCLLLGTFFLWRWWQRGAGLWWAVAIMLVPVMVLTVVALCCRQNELSVKLILGAVAFNVALSGGISLVSGRQLSRAQWNAWLWLGLGLAGCCCSAQFGQIGVYTGLGLIIVGLVALSYGWRPVAPQMTKSTAILQALWWVNTVLINLGLGFLAVITGGIHLTQSVVMVVLPWLAGMVLVTLVSLFMPKKTARVWGGLIVVLYLVLLWYSLTN